MRKTLLLALLPLAACGRLAGVGKAPEFAPLAGTNEYSAMYSYALPESADPEGPGADSSLWTASDSSLLGDRRAAQRGDILTVVIEIDDSAQISNSTGTARNGTLRMGIPSLFGIPQRLDERLPAGATMADAVNANSASTFQGDGSVARSERLTLRVAATVVDVLPNGVLNIEGSQEVRVNSELRELNVTGYVRPTDISRQNEITYDRIAGARISYGGRGLITDTQRPRWGQEAADAVLPF